MKTITSEIFKSLTKTEHNAMQEDGEVESVEMEYSLDGIKKAKELLDLGAITEEEFKEIKKKCLNKIK